MIKLFKLRDDKFFLIRSHVRRLMGRGIFFFFFCTSLHAFFFFFSKDICASFYACISLVTTSLYFMANVSRFINFKRVCAYIDFFFFCFFSEKFQRYIFVLKRGWNNIIICSIYRFHNYNYNMLALVVIVKIDFLRLLRR